MLKKRWTFLLTAALLTVTPVASFAMPLVSGYNSLSEPAIFNGADLEGRKASASFARSGGDLKITLSNTALQDILVPNQVLTAVFFDLAGNPNLLPSSAVLSAGSFVTNGGSTDPYVTDGVGGEWAFRCDFAFGETPMGAHYGISSTGADDVFGPHDRFPGENLKGPEGPDGLQYGILSPDHNLSTGNKKVLKKEPLIAGGVHFLLSGLPDSFDVASGISNVSFLYGTSMTVGMPPIPVTPPIPEPATILLLGATGVMGFVSKKRKKAACKN